MEGLQANKGPKPPSYCEVMCEICGLQLQRRYMPRHFGRRHKEIIFDKTKHVIENPSSPHYANSPISEAKSVNVRSKNQPPTNSGVKRRRGEDDALPKDDSPLIHPSNNDHQYSTTKSTGETQPTSSRRPEDSGTVIPLQSKSNGKSVQENTTGTATEVLTETARIFRCRDLDTLLQCANSFDVNESRTALVCLPCSKFGRGWGQITFNSAEGSDFRNKTQSESFLMLKQKLSSHLSSSKCHRLAMRESGMDIIQEGTTPEDFEAGLHVGNAAYECVKLGCGYKKFENVLQSYAARRINIGDINHSQVLAGQLNEQYFKLWKSHMQNVFHKILPSTMKPRHFSVVADKCTPTSDTLHVVGLITPYKKKPEAYLIGVIDNQAGSGAGLAKEVHSVLLDYFTPEQIKSRLVGGSWDGQYVHNSVETHLNTLVAQPNPNFSCYTWDMSHCIELAGKDSRRSAPKSKTLSPVVKETFDPIAELAARYGRGENWKELRKLAKEQAALDLSDLADYEVLRELKLREPRALVPFVKTRFTQYLSETINAARVNFSILYDLMERKQDPLLARFSSAPFVLRMNGLYDIYREITKLSLTAQRPDLFTWNVEESVEDALTVLNNMKPEFLELGNSERIVNYSNCVKEMKERGTYKRRSISCGRMVIRIGGNSDAMVVRKCFDNDIDQVSKEMSNHIDSFCQNLKNRYTKNQNEILQYTRNVFSLREIVSRQTETSPRHLKRLYEEANKGQVFPQECNFQLFQGEYQQFCRDVRESCNTYSENCSCFPDQALYMDMLHRESPYPNVMALLSASVSRTYCEAITEGMGSVVDTKLKGRERLSHHRLFQECFMAWNGPSLGRRSQKLIERGIDSHFNGKPWHFIRKSNKKYIKTYDVSKVVDKKEKEMDRMDPPSDWEI